MNNDDWLTVDRKNANISVLYNLIKQIGISLLCKDAGTGNIVLFDIIFFSNVSIILFIIVYVYKSF